MRFSRRQFVQLVTGATALPVMPAIAQAQAWPARVVRLLVGFPPGGGADATTRIIANRLSEVWDRQVVVENKPGVGGNVALDTAAHATPDGYTMVLATGAPAIYGFLLGSLNYDPVADLAPVTLIGTYPNMLVVSNASQMKSFADYLAAARANPGKVTFASPGVGTPGHLAGELLKQMAGINITHVPYRGVATGALSDVITGRVDAMFNTTGSLLQASRSGQVRALAVTSARRFQTAPEFPTLAESGVPGLDATSWYAIVVPGKTPAPVVQKMHADLVALLAEPAVKSRFEPLGLAVASSTPAELAARARADTALWGPVIKAANIKGE
jgi:tripartite-type tricarboxylate transporter receptor subunit TctC